MMRGFLLACFMVMMLPVMASAGAAPPPVSDEPRTEIDKCVVDGLGLSYNGTLNLDLNDIAVTCCPANGFFTGRVVYCVSIAIRETSERFLAQISDIMIPIIYALMAVALIIFGAKIMVGDSEVKEKGILLLFKFGLIFLLANNLGGFAPQIFRFSESAIGLVTTTLDFSGSYSCDISKLAASYASMTNSVIWQRMDCIIDRLFGTGVNTTLYNSFFAFLPSLLMGGAVAPAIVLIGLAAMIGVFTYVFKAIYTYLLAYLYLGFLIAISPMIIPLTLVPQYSSAVWHWVNLVIAAIAQPMMMFAYVAVTMPIMDQVIFGGGPYIEETLQEILPPEEQQAAYRQQQQYCSRAAALNPDMYETQGDTPFPNQAALNEANDPNAQLGNFMVPFLTNATDKCGPLSVTTVDFGPQHAEKIFDIMFASLKLMLVVIILAMGMETVPQVTYSIFGGSGLMKGTGTFDLTGGLLSPRTAGGVNQAAGQAASGAANPLGAASTATKQQLFRMVGR